MGLPAMELLKRLAENDTATAAAIEPSARLRQRIRHSLLQQSRYIQVPNFARCSDGDLKLLFNLYDESFFRGEMGRETLRQSGKACVLKFNGRLTSSGGITRRSRLRKTGLIYAIEVSSRLLFHNFRTPGETPIVSGLPCPDRLDALMRIMEHEMLHLGEFLAWGESNCNAGRFQHLAAVLFGHAAHKHGMLTPRQKTLATTTFRPGDIVQFTFDGVDLRGMINRINQRATILVENPKGARYQNGKRYLKYYLPLARLRGER
jgi:hypothetical protein